MPAVCTDVTQGINIITVLNECCLRAAIIGHWQLAIGTIQSFERHTACYKSVTFSTRGLNDDVWFIYVS